MLFLFFKSDDFKGTYALLSKSVDKNPAKYERGVKEVGVCDVMFVGEVVCVRLCV